MDISNVGFGIDSFWVTSVKREKGRGPVYDLGVEGVIEINAKQDPFTGTMKFVKKTGLIPELLIITSDRVASYNTLEALLTIRSQRNGYSILGKVSGGKIDGIKAKLSTEASEVDLGDLEFDANPCTEALSTDSSPSVAEAFNSPALIPYKIPLELLVVHALIMRNEVTDPILIDDLTRYVNSH